SGGWCGTCGGSEEAIMADTENATDVLDEILDEQVTPAPAADGSGQREPVEPESAKDVDQDVPDVGDELPAPPPAPVSDYIVAMPSMLDDEDVEAHEAVLESFNSVAPAAGLD